MKPKMVKSQLIKLFPSLKDIKNAVLIIPW
jgi:hypothetical protein